MSVIRRISTGTTTHSDSHLVLRGFFIMLLVGLVIGYYLGGM